MDITILMEDLNAIVGNDNTGHGKIMRHDGLQEWWIPMERALLTCIPSTPCQLTKYFPHTRIHQQTWRSPDLKTQNQIDHVCMWVQKSRQDMPESCGALRSDHHLMVCRMKQKLNRTSMQPVKQRKVYNVHKFRITPSNGNWSKKKLRFHANS